MQATESAALVFEDVHKRYVTGIDRCRAVVRALQGVTLEVAAGESISLVGRRGAGKSTVLLCAAGLMVPDRGRVLVHGRSLHEVRVGVRYVAARGRLSVAETVASARDPSTRLLLIDDVADEMDLCSREELLAVLTARASDGCSAVLATCDESLARRLRLRTLELRGGTVHTRATVDLLSTARVAERRDDISTGRL